MNRKNHPEIQKQIRIEKLIENPRLFGDFCEFLFLFDADSPFSQISNLLNFFCYLVDKDVLIFDFGGLGSAFPNLKGGRVAVKREDLAYLFKYCDAVVGDTYEESFFIKT
jgi:hypothetical protein